MPREYPITDLLDTARDVVREIAAERDALLDALRTCAASSTPQHERERVWREANARVDTARREREARLRRAVT